MNYTEVVNEIRSHLLEYLEYLDIDSGKKFSCLHPEHDEKTPSACVIPGTNLCKCFGCGRTYNVFDIALYKEDMPDKGDGFITKTIPYLINTLNLPIDISDINTVDFSFFKERKKITDMFGAITDIANNELVTNTNTTVNDEISRRGWNEELQSVFCIGQSFDIMDSLNDLDSKGITRYTLEQSGVINGTRSILMNNSESIVFPLLSKDSSVIGLAVRTNQRGLKYINTQNNQVFNKSKYLYGIHLYDSKVDTAVLVEGYADVITLTGAGVKNAFAYCSSTFSAKQIETLYTTNISNIVFFTDNDAASINGVINSIKKNYDALLPYNIYVRASAEGDPDDYVRAHGYDGFMKLKKLDFFTFYIKLMLSNGIDSETLCNNVLDMLVQHSSELAVEKRLRAIYLAFDGIFSSDAIKKEYINRRQGISIVSKNKVERMKRFFVKEINQDQSPDSVIEKVSSFYAKLTEISASKTVNISPLSLIERVNTQEEVESSRTGDVEAYRFNRFPQFQDAIDGAWERSGLLTFGGVPNTGKTTLFCNLALDLALSNTEASNTKDVVSVIHSIDDEADVIISKLVAIIVANKFRSIRINAFRHPNYYRKEIKDLDELRAYGYSEVKRLISTGKLLVLDSKHGKSIRRIRDIMEYIHNTMEKQPIYFLDNFHKIESVSNEKRAETEHNSNSLQEYSQLYSMPILTTVEYKKFERPREPNNSDIKETGAIEYDAKFVAHLHNDIHTFREDAKLYVIDNERRVLLPLIKLIIGKSKLNSFKGNLYFVFDPEVGTYREATKKEIHQVSDNQPYKVAKDSLLYEDMYRENAAAISGMVETL